MSVIVDDGVLGALQDAVGAEFLAELIETFLAEAPGMFAELQEAATTGDAEAIRRAAHSLKSNANTFGAHGFAEAARRIEMEGLGEAPNETIVALRGAFDPVAAALKARLDG